MQYRLLLALAALLVGPVRAQITITEADLRPFASGAYVSNTFSSDDPTRFQALTQLRGGPHTFNFNVGSYTAEDPTRFSTTTCSPTLPGCDDPHLSAAGIVQRIETPSLPGVAVQFVDLDASGYRLRGGASRGDFDPTRPGEESFKYVTTPASLVFPLPLQMGRTWTSSYQFEMTYNGTVVGTDPTTDTGEVLAYGTLVTPVGHDQALLVRERSISTSTFGGQTTNDTTFTYSFVTRGALQASLFTDAQGNVLGADYSVLAPTTAVTPADDTLAGLVLDAPAPNPAQDATRLAFTLAAPGSARLSVHDLLGREVDVAAEGTFAAGRHEASLDVSRLAPGAYVVRLTAEGTVRTRILSVAR
ncbi:MAG TPA: T9SS type A sorting domain-containing protein [Rhodothermales bacterium]|nr:T9SS type A sorting domain-containing protein [Rhodothermales bacterium]